MRTYVSTLGFHETRVTRPVIKNGLDDGDRIVLVRPAEEGNTDRATDAVGYVKDMVEEIEPGATVTVERVDTTEFTTAVLQSSDILSAIDPERELNVNFGGGAREVLLPLLIAAVLHAPLVDQAFQYTDVDQEVQALPVPNLTTQIPSNAVDTFELIATIGEEVTLPDLAAESERSKSTIGRHVEALAESGVVTTRMETNTKYIICSQTGRLMYRANKTPPEQ
jgi:CRISPR-associated protein Csa3